MSKLVTLYDNKNKNNIVYPYTVSNAVFFSNGQILGDNLLNTLLSNAVFTNTTFDYNNLLESNVYYLDGSNPIIAANGPYGNSNNPTNSYLFVVKGTNNNRVTQLILPGNDPDIYIRSKITDSTTWRKWKKINTINLWEMAPGIITPAMYSNNVGSWSCAASHPYNSSYPAYKAFDQNENYVSDFYHSTATMPQWISIGSSEIKWLPIRLEMYNGQGSTWVTRMPGTFILQGSNDNINWTDIVTLTKSGSYSYNSWDTNIEIKLENFYNYWRMYITASCTSDNYMNIGAINYYGYIIEKN